MVLLFLAEARLYCNSLLFVKRGFTGGYPHANGLGILFYGETHTLFSFQDVYLQILIVTLQLPIFSSFECCVVSLKSVVFFYVCI